MHQEIKKITLLAALTINLLLSACGGGGAVGGTNGAAKDYVSINGVTYTANGSATTVTGFIDQTSQYSYYYGGPAAYIGMFDTQSGNLLSFQVLSTPDGFVGVHSFSGTNNGSVAYIKDTSVATGGNMLDLLPGYGTGAGTGGSIAIDSFGAVGQPITGSFNVSLCDSKAVCATSIKNYTGALSINRSANTGSLARPANLVTPTPTTTNYTFAIHPTTGKNHFTIPTNATGGTLGIVLQPTVDVNMAVFTDPGFTTPATCNIASNLNVVGNGAETCSISVTANQKIYVMVSQPAAATAVETFTFKYAE